MKKHILFVDDEVKILQGLRRMLRGMRNEWKVAFARSGAEALKIMAKANFDVIVSDMRMPEMDGAELLTRVKQAYPQTVRIILSGHADKETIMRTVRPVHQYLSKPCDADALKAVISRACALKDLLAADRLQHLVSQMEALPSLPTLYCEVMEALQESDCSARQIGEIIAKDISMTAKILQMVNSAFFGTPRHFSNPVEAVVFLGLNTVKSLVLTFGLFAKFDNRAIPGVVIESIYTHSLQTGILARKIAVAEKMDRKQTDNAFMAGLLHDLGKLVLADNLSDSYREVLDLTRETGVDYNEAEQSIIGATHGQVGAYLLGLWGLPDPIIEAVAFHHHPGNGPNMGVRSLSVVHAANSLEHYQGDDNGSIPGLDLDYVADLGLIDHTALWRALAQSETEKSQSDAR